MAGKTITRFNAQIAPEFEALVRKLPKRMEQRVYDKAVTTAARVIRDEAKDRLGSVLGGGVNTRYFAVRKFKKKTLATGEKAAAQVGVSPDKWYLQFTEYGRQALQFDKPRPMHLEDGSVVFTKKTKAITPKPFWRPALVAKGHKANSVMLEETRTGLLREATALVAPWGKYFK